MKRLAVIFSILLIASLVSCELLGDETSNPLSSEEVAQGLKKALNIGLDNSVKSASSPGGYLKNEIIKIILPDEVKELQSKIETESILGGKIPLKTVYNAYIGLKNDDKDLFSELIGAMNSGAESAANKAVPIFASAITSMTFSDAMGILKGSDTSATNYFFQKTNKALFEAFNPEVKSALDKTGANKIYASTVGFLNYEYSALGLATVSPKDVLNVNLPESIDGYATNKAIGGLFHLIGEEEKKIRENPFKWSSSIIERVFGSLKN